jgi:putative transcriptional regulator
MSETSCLKDHFLIALPSLQDANFSRSVTYLCEHTDEGAMGIVINRPSALELPDILQHMEIEQTDRTPGSLPVFMGGPVQEERGFLIHSPPKRWKSTLVITNDIAITTSRDILQAIATGEGPAEVLIALGYAGWGPGQLEQELQQDSWLVAPASREIIFHTPVEKRWAAAAALAGVDLNLITSTAGHA